MTATTSPPAPPATRRIQWLAVAFYYVLACLISWPIFWWRDLHPASWAAFGASGAGGFGSFASFASFGKGWLPALGPCLAGLLALALFPRARNLAVGLWGSSLGRSVLFAAAPVAIYTAVGRGSDEPHLTALLVGLIYLVYALLEETGWRGFLQGALTPLPQLRRYLLIGVMWGAWHFTTFTLGEPRKVLPRLALMLVLWTFGSWGIGRALEKTGSLLVCAVLHLIFNLSTAMPLKVAGLVLGGSAVVWVLLLRTWPAGETTSR